MQAVREVCAHEYNSMTFFLSYPSDAGTKRSDSLLTEEEGVAIECPLQMN